MAEFSITEPEVDHLRARLLVIASEAMSRPLSFGYFVRRAMQEVVEPLAQNAAALGEQREAVLKLHTDLHWCRSAAEGGGTWTYGGDFAGPCPTAQALGVTA